jgi:thiol-disulfide isomerase/thioredoxin
MGIRSNVGMAVLATGLVTMAVFGYGASQNKAESQVKSTSAGRVAPNFVGINAWLNSDPLNIADLRGKVVLVDFWTFACINCIRTLPHVTRLYDIYKDKGLVIVGIHTPEFPFEKATGNVRAAIKRFGIRYPVVQDNEFSTWNAYRNRYWPAQYIIDKSGKIVFEHAGEGQYDVIEQMIQQILNTNS